MDKNIIMVLYIHQRQEQIDIEVPINITANELVVALNQGFSLGINTNNIEECYLKTENPIALLKGNKTLEEYRLRNGTIINFTN